MSDPPTAPSVAVQLLHTDRSPSNDSIDYRCGICCWRPRCLRRCSNICAFIVAACFISCLQAAFSGYIASQVTTLEKRFAVGSSVIGFINGFFEVGYIVSVIFVSYAGGRSHVPCVISVGLFTMATGALLWSMPHFIFPYETAVKTHPINPFCLRFSNETRPDPSSNCLRDRSSGYGFLPMLFLAQLLIGSGSSPILTLIPPFIDDHVPAAKAPRMIASQYASSAMGPVLGFALGAFVLQYPADFFTASPLKPDDPNWIGAWWAGFILFGILVSVGGLLLLTFPRRLSGITKAQHQKSPSSTAPHVILENGIIVVQDDPAPPKSNLNGVTVDSQSVDSYHTAVTNPQEVIEINRGASNLNPNEVRDGGNDAPETPHSVTHSDRQISRCYPCMGCTRPLHTCSSCTRCRLFKSSNRTSTFIDSVRSLLRNRVYMIVCLGICSEMFMVIGFASFLPKYLEMEYQVTKSVASIIAGGIIVPVGALGILVGGLILERFPFHRRDAIRFVLIVNAIITACIVSFFFLGCQNPPIAGVTVPYSQPNNDSKSSPFQWPAAISLKPDYSLSDQCNADCNCDPTFWSPICHKERNMSYASPCLAGCTGDPVIEHQYTKCSCLNGSSDDTAVPGLCQLNCGRLGYFVFVLAVCLFLTGVTQNPLIMVTMRSVSYHERSFALGLQFVIIRVLANLPAPMVFGRVIDEACLFWRSTCGRRGDCAFVDVRALNLYVTSLGMTIKGSGFIFYLILFYLLRSGSSSGRTDGIQLGMNVFARKPSAPLSGPRALHRPSPANE